MTAPVLACPDHNCQFFLEVDASSFALGAVLFQKDELGKWWDIAYFSKALMATKWNYDIWDWEFLAIVVAFWTWWHLLAGTQDLVQVLTDHANLQYYWHLQKINHCIAWYINFLKDFNYQLKHILGVSNWADALSQRPDHDNGSGDNDQIVALLDKVFAKVISKVAQNKVIRRWQWTNLSQIKDWANKYHLTKDNNGIWYKGTTIVVIGGEEDHQKLLEVYHDALTAGHPGMAKTLWALSRDYWWLGTRCFVYKYSQPSLWTS